ncbi:hypothetical protein ACOYW6_08050 [Parablastomonas sp. CN1-191]|uniref:hypothetical protein n=1 Tax=Parablastomonas sp. CN1-191 TaxID=3400908 RepID=UPI003BF7E157
MKKVISAVVASTLALASVSAQAATRPEAARFSQPVAAGQSDQLGGGMLWIWIALFAALAAIIQIAKSNSPD